LRAVSQYRNYGGPVAQSEEKMVLANGKEQVTQKLLMAGPWVHGDVTEWERAAALAHFGHIGGLTEGEDPVTRLATFDSHLAQQLNGWTDEERQIVEATVRATQCADHVVVETPKVPAPYAKYDQHRKTAGRRTLEHVLADITTAYETSGFDLGQAVMYERENLNDPAVISALEALGAVAAETEELVEA
jgi:hypothetical protein